MIVPDDQLSLAIGREGQNARLAAKLTGWRIDIKSATLAETERLEASRAAAQAAKASQPEAETTVESSAQAEEAAVQPSAAEAEQIAEATPEELLTDLGMEEEFSLEEDVEEPEEAFEGEPITEESLIPPAILFQQAEAESKSGIRFAEDIMAPRRGRTGGKDKKAKTKKKKKGTGTFIWSAGDDAVKARKSRQDFTVTTDEDE